jgi:hypothetical protein
MEWFTSTNDLYERDDGIPRGTMVFLEGGKEKCVQCIYCFHLFRFILYDVGSVKCVLDYFRVLLYRL